MNQENSKEVFWNAYEKLPDELKDAIFAESTVENISKACTDNGLPEEQISEVSKQTGRVLMGLLSPREFPITLELELSLDSDQARKISWDIDRLIFSHLRISLNKLYTENIADSKKVSDNKKEEGIENKEQAPKKEEQKSDTKDQYREPLI
jgi:hypothetical protein